ncbi:MAG: HAD hydrolase-like protein [Deltaproteobacteria bacterium]|nr:HAD hydrolase-like protein [Deltaproteobacteria bacterium]
MDLDLTKCVFVGDTLKDFQAGNRAGCRTVLVQSGQGKESLIKILSGKTRIRPDWGLQFLGCGNASNSEKFGNLILIELKVSGAVKVRDNFFKIVL